MHAHAPRNSKKKCKPLVESLGLHTVTVQGRTRWRDQGVENDLGEAYLRHRLENGLLRRVSARPGVAMPLPLGPGSARYGGCKLRGEVTASMGGREKGAKNILLCTMASFVCDAIGTGTCMVQCLMMHDGAGGVIQDAGCVYVGCVS